MINILNIILNIFKLIINYLGYFGVLFFSILFSFLIFNYILNGFKYSENKIIRFLQKSLWLIISVGLLLSLILYYIIGLPEYYNSDEEFNKNQINNTNNKFKMSMPKGDNEISFTGSCVISAEAGKEISKGITSSMSQIGLGTSIGGLAAAAAKAISNSPMGPIPKVGAVIAAGLAGGAIHSGFSNLNKQKAFNLTKSMTSEGLAKNSALDSVTTNSSAASPAAEIDIPDIDNQFFIPSILEVSPMEDLITNIFYLNGISLYFTLLLTIQLIIKYYVDFTSIQTTIVNWIKFIFPNNTYANKIRGPITVTSNKISEYFILFVLIILILSLLASMYFSYELLNNLESFCDTYYDIKNKYSRH